MSTTADYAEVAQQLYLSYFGRPADHGGLLAMTSQMAAAGAPTGMAGIAAASQSNGTLKAMLDTFSASDESAALYGAGSDARFVSAVYANLLSRSPDQAGLDFWVGALANQSVSRAAMAANIVAAVAKSGGDAGDQLTLSHKTAAAAYFSGSINTEQRIQAYEGADAAMALRSALQYVDGGTTVEQTRQLMDAAWLPLSSVGAELVGVQSLSL